MPLKMVESKNINGFENALNDSLDYLESEGLADINDTTEVTVILKKNGKVIDGSFGVDAQIFTGATTAEVTKYLAEHLPPPPPAASGFKQVV